MAVNGYKFTALTGGGAGALDAQDGAGLGDGDIAIVMASGTLYLYQLSASSGAAESSPNIIAPDTNAGTKRWLIQRTPQTNTVPVGSIIAWQGCYYTNSANAGATQVMGADATALNALVSADGWRVCNGAALNLSGSPIYDGAGRYLPNLQDSRFLVGNYTAGIAGGTNDTPAHNHTHSHSHFIDHTHTTGSFTLTTNEIPSHYHSVGFGGAAGTMGQQIAYGTGVGGDITGSTGGGAAHNHGATSLSSMASSHDASTASTSTLAAQENRPLFLTCQYIQKVI